VSELLLAYRALVEEVVRLRKSKALARNNSARDFPFDDGHVLIPTPRSDNEK
jgi:hypothetical protein